MCVMSGCGVVWMWCGVLSVWWCMATESKSDRKQTESDRSREPAKRRGASKRKEERRRGARASDEWRLGGPAGHWAREASCTRRKRRARGRHSREQRGGLRHGRRGKAVATCWEQCWQNRTLLDLLRGGRQLRSRFRECAHLSYVARRMSR